MWKRKSQLLWLLLGFLLGCQAVPAPESAATEAPPAETAALPMATEAAVPPSLTNDIQDAETQADAATAASEVTPSLEAVSQQAEEIAEVQHLEPLTTVAFAGAGSIDFTLNGEGNVYLAYGEANNVYVVQSADGGATFSEPVVASLEANVFVYPIERPAIAVGEDGRLHVAWSEDSFPGHIWYAVSEDNGQTFSPSVRLSEEGPETVLVRLLLQPDDDPLAVWLQNSQLHYTRSGETESGFLPDRVLDDQTCDCCHPQPLWQNGTLHIAYRNLVIDEDGRHIRDIYLLTSADGGDTFAEPVRISDEPWYISACPFSGPSSVSDGEALFVSWMDGRHDDAGNFSQTDIWLATSTDEGQTFSANRRINEPANGYNNLPSLALTANGRLHIIWQADEDERAVIYYTYSDDDGQTFEPAQPLVDSNDNNGRSPTNATLFVDEAGIVYVSWLDGVDGYLGLWQTTEGK